MEFEDTVAERIDLAGECVFPPHDPGGEIETSDS
nr:MAG TPA: hypothetical protein [Caudoviricetes sp.]